MSTDLTARQTQVLEFIRRHLEESGMPPTRMEIARALNFRSPNAAEDHLKALARKGVLELTPGTSRGLRLKDIGVPVVGRVAAGNPILAEQHIEARYQLDPALFHPRPDYLLKVRGMSMRDAGILDGDLLAVRRAPTARTGEIVVARLDDEVTVKRYWQQRNKVVLFPANPEFEPITLDLTRQALAIEGVAVGVIRNGGLA